MNKVLFIGSKQLGFDCMAAMHRISPETFAGAITLDDTADSRTCFTTFKEYCSQKNIPLHISKNRAHAEEIIKEIKPDLVVVVGWYWLISDSILKETPYGFMGIHNSLLPYYRGGSPLIWGIINGEKEVGFSMFSFSDGMDEGDIWFQYKTPLSDTDYVADVLKRLEDAAVAQLEQHYPAILNGTLKPAPQNHALATYCAQRQPEDGNINWQWDAKRIYNFIRAQSAPYPGAFSFYKEKKVTLWRATPLPHIYYGTPGQVFQVRQDGVIVVCGNDTGLLLQEVEIDGSRAQAQTVLKSIKVRLVTAPTQL